MVRTRTWVITGAVVSAAAMLGSGTAGAAPATAVPGDGLYRVGVDIAPGIYQSAGPADPAHPCVWKRLRHIAEPGDTADPNTYLVASDYVHISPVRVMVKPSDAGFDTANCGGWVMMPAPPATGSYGPGGTFGSEY